MLNFVLRVTYCFFRSLSPFSSLSFAGCRLLFLFLCLSLALYSKFVGMTINLQKQFPLSVFVLLAWLFSCDAWGYAISRQNNTSCLWVAIPVDWVILHWHACGADWRSASGRCTVKWLPNFLEWVDLFIHGAALACVRAPLPYFEKHGYKTTVAIVT